MRFNKINEDVFYLEGEKSTDRPNLIYVKGQKFSLIFDCGNSKSHMACLMKNIQDHNLPMPRYAVVSHWHWDHSFGMNAFDGETILSRETNDKLNYLSSLKWDEVSVLNRLETGEEIEFAYKAMKNEYEDFDDIKVISGDIVFENSLTLNLGNKTCEIIKVGGPHEIDSSVLLLKEDRILLAADAHSGDYYNNDGKFDRDRLVRYIETLEALDFDLYVPGHDNPVSKETILLVLKRILDRF